MICPHCAHENIDGADVCDECQQPLDYLTDPQPATDLEQQLIETPLRRLVRGAGKPVTVSAKTPLGEVLKLLVDRRIGCVLVTEGDKLVGIFSERDALLRVNVNAARMSAAPISEVMTPNPEALDLDDKIAFALHKMDVGHYRHVPLLDDGRVAGVVSARDIMRFITAGLVARV
jgi:CBS domain-containing protein